MKSEFKNIKPVLSEYVEFNKLKESEYILSNLKHRHYLKINKETYNLLNLIDGTRNLLQIQKLYNDIYKKHIELEQIESLLYIKLSKYGILTGYEDLIIPYQKPDYLKLSFIIFNERIVSKIVKNFMFLFKFKIALFVIVSCISVLIILGILNFDAYKSFNLQESLIYFFIIMAVSVTLHEIGHASSAHFFGAKHGGIGGGFYLFTPVYYADVTDIWRLSKWQRIVVNLSGMYFELIFCTLVALIGYFTNNFVLTILAIIICVNTLLNLNPFLRSDGYWVLTDLTDKPNLLYHSFMKVKDIYRIIKGNGVKWTKTDILLVIYGLVSYGFIGLFLYYVLFKNPNSILNFPNNAIEFIKSIFDKDQEVTLAKYGELIIPLMFYYLLFNLLKVGLKKGIEKI
ncbi:MAG: peptidase, M50 family protein [Flavobacteriaceae bacterium]|nr:peptidase, M50 family protein [Flavobacteriaceae bacterium]